MKPITREEMYLAAAAGYEVTPPEPKTRKEKFLAKLAGMEVETPAVFTRQERFLDEAAVALSRSVIEPLEITENGTYTAPDGVDGYSPVTVNVPTPEVVLQDKTITENGTYTADEGFDGLGSVTVDVAGSGGGNFRYKQDSFNGGGWNATISNGSVTFNHYCYSVPDVIMIVPRSYTNGYLKFCVGFSQAMLEKISDTAKSSVSVLSSTGLTTRYTTTSGFDVVASGENYVTYGGIRDVTDTSFTVGSQSNPIQTNILYDFYILYGLT